MNDTLLNIRDMFGKHKERKYEKTQESSEGHACCPGFGWNRVNLIPNTWYNAGLDLG